MEDNSSTNNIPNDNVNEESLLTILQNTSPATVNILERLHIRDVFNFCENSKEVEKLCELETDFWKKKFHDDYPQYKDNIFFIYLLENVKDINWYSVYKRIRFYTMMSRQMINIIEYFNTGILTEEGELLIWSAFWYNKLLEEDLPYKPSLETINSDVLGFSNNKLIYIIYFLNKMKDTYSIFLVDELKHTPRLDIQYMLYLILKNKETDIINEYKNSYPEVEDITAYIDPEDEIIQDILLLMDTEIDINALRKEIYEKKLSHDISELHKHYTYNVKDIIESHGNDDNDIGNKDIDNSNTEDDNNIDSTSISNIDIQDKYISPEELSKIERRAAIIHRGIQLYNMIWHWKYKLYELFLNVYDIASLERKFSNINYNINGNEIIPEDVPRSPHNETKVDFFLLYQRLKHSELKFQGKASYLTGMNVHNYLINIDSEVLNDIFEDGEIPINIHDYDDVPDIGTNEFLLRIDNIPIKKVFMNDNFCIKIDHMSYAHVNNEDEFLLNDLINIENIVDMNAEFTKFMVSSKDNVIYHFDTTENIAKWKQSYLKSTNEDFNVNFRINIDEINPQLRNLRYDYIKLILPEEFSNNSSTNSPNNSLTNDSLLHRNINCIKYITTINSEHSSIVAFSPTNMYIFSNEDNIIMRYAKDIIKPGIPTISPKVNFSWKDGMEFGEKYSTDEYFSSLILPYYNIDDLKGFIQNYFKESIEHDLGYNSFWNPVVINLELQQGELIKDIYTFKSGYNIILTTRHRIIAFYIEKRSDNSSEQDYTIMRKKIEPFNWLFLGVNKIEQLIVNDMNILGVVASSSSIGIYFDKLQDFIGRNLSNMGKMDVDRFIKRNHFEFEGYEDYLEKLYNIFFNSSISGNNKVQIQNMDLIFIDFDSMRLIQYNINYGTVSLKVVLGKSSHRYYYGYTDLQNVKVNYGKTLFITRANGLLSKIDIENNEYSYIEDLYHIDEVHCGKDCIILFTKGYEYITDEKLNRKKNEMKYCSELIITEDNAEQHTIRRCSSLNGNTYETFYKE